MNDTYQPDYDDLIGKEDKELKSHGTIDILVDEKYEEIEVHRKELDKQKKNNSYKVIYVHFRNKEDCEDFCKLINHPLTEQTKRINYLSGQLSELDDIEISQVIVKEKERNANDEIWKKHWKEMPEFVNEDNPPYRSIDVHFSNKEDYKHFAKTINQKLSDRTKSIWHPKLYIDDNGLKRWVVDEEINPQYPVYIISKGRWDSRSTNKSLERMKVPHYVVIEEQELPMYQNAMKNNQYTTILTLPFSNLGSSTPARNWCWDHSKTLGAKRHWIMDDNIDDFYRLHENQRVRVESGAMFKACEDFVDRYENVPVSGLQYRFFVAPNSKYPPFLQNTRVFSCLLIENTCSHRWRGRYNEDVDLSIRVLKDGYCTILFYQFLQGKAATQTVKGGNMSEFYASEGTYNKSKMLYDHHPDVVTLEKRYGRWHHHVHWDKIKMSELKLKQNLNLEEKVNNYGMRFIDNFEKTKH